MPPTSMTYARLQVADAVVETRVSSRRKALGGNRPVAMALTLVADMYEPDQRRKCPNCENPGVDPVTGIAYYTWQAHLSMVSIKTDFTCFHCMEPKESKQRGHQTAADSMST